MTNVVKSKLNYRDIIINHIFPLLCPYELLILGQCNKKLHDSVQIYLESDKYMINYNLDCCCYDKLPTRQNHWKSKYYDPDKPNCLQNVFDKTCLGYYTYIIDIYPFYIYGESLPRSLYKIMINKKCLNIDTDPDFDESYRKLLKWYIENDNCNFNMLDQLLLNGINAYNIWKSIDHDWLRTLNLDKFYKLTISLLDNSDRLDYRFMSREIFDNFMNLYMNVKIDNYLKNSLCNGFRCIVCKHNFTNNDTEYYSLNLNIYENASSIFIHNNCIWKFIITVDPSIPEKFIHFYTQYDYKSHGISILNPFFKKKNNPYMRK